MSLPIVFIHRGYANYLELAVRQARSTNPDTPLYLIGDTSYPRLKNICTYQSMDDYADCDMVLKNIYQHHNTNEYHYQYFCFGRWFFIREFMRQHQFDWIVVLDSDVMLYSPLQSYFDRHIRHTNKHVAFCIRQQEHDSLKWSASAHTSFISRDFVEQFCTLMLETYEHNMALLQPKIDYHQRTGTAGGICDMTYFYLYHHTNPQQVYNLLIPQDGAAFDLNMNIAQNYLMDEFPVKDGFKDISFKQKIPYGKHADGHETAFHTLHFQGEAKNRMQDYYTGRADSNIFTKIKKLFRAH